MRVDEACRRSLAHCSRSAEFCFPSAVRCKSCVAITRASTQLRGLRRIGRRTRIGLAVNPRMLSDELAEAFQRNALNMAVGEADIDHRLSPCSRWWMHTGDRQSGRAETTDRIRVFQISRFPPADARIRQLDNEDSLRWAARSHRIVQPTRILARK